MLADHARPVRHGDGSVWSALAAQRAFLWQRIMAAGEPYEIRPTGPVDIRRIEGGIFN
jgi:hypothetical protein